MREDVIEAARLVASEPSDLNLAMLISAVMAWPFTDMPEEYLIQLFRPPIRGSIGEEVAKTRGPFDNSVTF